MMDFGISAEELRQTIICISAQRLIRKPDGDIGAIFEIIEGDMLDEMTDSIMRGERVNSPKEMQINTLVNKYRKPQHEYDN